ncbi:hypothetical protein TIFTF001_013330 [Ficus carica]|uniref:DNA polymerase delta subunit 4 n=1 Tax=Ficus carica TaxID=3494 RepID=A0AA88A483_FICCA|nr:hypothetical protein TIFTF001_013330 [Ficus carica]
MSSSKNASIKGIYREKKKSGISKKKTSTKSPSASIGSDLAQPPAALLSASSPDLQEEYDKEEEEEVLRQFDMNMAYGPCVGMSRLARWERASRLGLNPPQQVHHLLHNSPNVSPHCLWEASI